VAPVARISGETFIARPVEEVFDFVADQRNEPLFNPRMLRAEKTTTAPVGVGTRWAAAMASRREPLELVIEVTEFARPTRLGTLTSMAGADIQGALTFEPVTGGTRMRWDWDLRPRGGLRVLGPVLGIVGRRQERAIWAGLKTCLEEQGHRRPQ
jgi:Polyketide cyclase / dehydrase and lipid transport